MWTKASVCIFNHGTMLECRDSDFPTKGARHCRDVRPPLRAVPVALRGGPYAWRSRVALARNRAGAQSRWPLRSMHGRGAPGGVRPSPSWRGRWGSPHGKRFPKPPGGLLEELTGWLPGPQSFAPRTGGAADAKVLPAPVLDAVQGRLREILEEWMAPAPKNVDAEASRPSPRAGAPGRARVGARARCGGDRAHGAPVHARGTQRRRQPRAGRVTSLPRTARGRGASSASLSGPEGAFERDDVWAHVCQPAESRLLLACLL